MARRGTERDLRYMFRRYNKFYFSSKLQEPQVIRFADLSKEGNAAEINFPQKDGEHTKILISKDFRRHPSEVKISMLHEMIHLSIGPDCKSEHGMRFQAEMWRLINEGALDGLL